MRFLVLLRGITMAEEENHFDHTVVVLECETARTNGGSVRTKSPFRVSIDYINNTQHYVNMRLRNGVIVPYEPNYRGNDKFTVVVEMTLGFTVVQAIYNQVCAELMTGVKSDELQAIKEAIEARADMSNTCNLYSRDISIYLEFSITAEQLEQHKTVYLKEPDVVLSIDHDFPIPYHPRSKQTEHLNVLNALGNNKKRAGHHTGILYVSSDRNAQSKYVVIMGEIIQLDPICDIRLVDGVYVYQRSTEQKEYDRAEKQYYRDKDNVLVEVGLGNEVDMSTIRLLKDVDSKAKIFNTRQEAVDSMDSESRYKAEATKAAIELQQLKHENELNLLVLSKQRENDEARHKEELYIIEQERKRQENLFELNKIAYKDEYDRRSIDRKDSSEAVKWIPGIITGLGAVFGIFSVFLKK